MVDPARRGGADEEKKLRSGLTVIRSDSPEWERRHDYPSEDEGKHDDGGPDYYPGDDPFEDAPSPPESPSSIPTIFEEHHLTPISSDVEEDFYPTDDDEYDFTYDTGLDQQESFF